MQGFIFNQNDGETPESLRRKREIAQALVGNSFGSVPKNVGEGLAQFGSVLAYRKMMKDAKEAEKTGRASGSSAMADIVGALTGYSDYPAAPAAPGASSSSIPMPGAAGEIAASAPGASSFSGGDIYSGFMDTVRGSGLTNPYGLAAVAATGRAESGFSPANANRSWSDPSESGQPGTAGGIMSWRGPRLQALYQYAATRGEQPGNISPQTQAEFFMREDPQLIERLNSARSVEEAQSIINGAWKFAGYNRPGGEAARRMSYASAFLPEFQGQGTEVASLDPLTGLPPAAAAIEATAPGSGYVDPTVKVMPPQGGAQPGSSPGQGGGFDMGRFGDGAPVPQGASGLAAELDRTNAASSTPQIAAALAAPMPQPPADPKKAAVDALMANSTPAPRSPNIQKIVQAVIAASSNPWLNDNQRQIVNAMMSDLLDQQKEERAAAARDADPMRRLQLERAQLELEAMRNPQPKPQFRQATPDEAQRYGVPNGQFGPDGRFYPVNPPSGTSLQVDPETGAVTFQQGSGVKPLTEGQSKDAVFSTRAEGALGILDQHANTLADFYQKTASGVPIVGNYLTSPEFQKAQQAGKEFLQAILRKDTGAAITREETAEYGSVYLPSPGDSPEVLAQKAASRRRALEAIKAGMPPQAILQQERALAASSGEQPTAAEPDTGPPDGMDPKDWEFLTPEERRLFQ